MPIARDLRTATLPFLVDNATGRPVGVQTARGETVFLPGFAGDDFDRSLVGGKMPMAGGLRMAITGASTESRANTMWDATPATYQRINGVVTVTMTYTLQDKPFPVGHRIRLVADKRADLEGTFEITSAVVTPSTSTVLQYRDNRADVALGSVSGSTVMAVHDTHVHAITAGWPMYMNMALGGRLDVSIIATGSTNSVDEGIDGWGDERISQIAAQGPFDIVFIGGGLIGNAINGGGYTVTRAFNGLARIIRSIAERVQPKIVLVEGLPPNANTGITPTSAVTTAALRLQRKLWRDLQRQFPFVRVVPNVEAMVTNYSAFNASPSTDYLNGRPESTAMATDGVHPVAPYSRVRGLVVADSLRDIVSPWASPEMGFYSDTRQVNNVVDNEGFFNPNWLPGLWGNIDATKVTLANAGCSGSGPAGGDVNFTAGRGTTTAVGALLTDPNGGGDWQVTITSTAGSTSGFTCDITHAPTALLSALQNASVQGKFVDIFLPLTLQVVAGKILWVAVELVATIGGTSFVVAGAQGQDGLYTMAAQSRALDAGYSGVLRFPRFKVPSGTYTTATFRVRVKEINGSQASGTTIVRWGPGQRFEVLED